MATNWKDLKHKATSEQREQVRREAVADLERIGYTALRRARDLTQVEIAQRLNIPQSAVSRMESQSDLLLSTLAKYIRAMGGELQMQAVFPEGTFDLAPPAASAASSTDASLVPAELAKTA